MVEYKYSFCELFAKKILPSLKLYIAYRLVVEHGFSQLETSKILGVKQPLVNYVVLGKRKPKYIDALLEIPGVKDLLDDVVSKIVENRSGVLDGASLACILCMNLRREDYLREVIQKLGYSVEEVYLPSKEQKQ